MSETGSEARVFVTLVIFIIISTGLIVTMPSDLQGQGETGSVVTPLDPSLTSDFSEAENYTESAFSFDILTGWYDYDALGGYDWRVLCDPSGGDEFSIAAKIKVGGVIWLGGLSYVDFISPTNENLGTILTFIDIDNDASEGTVRYTLTFEDNGNSAGSLVLYWNSTTYSDSETAWNNDKLYFVHGFGFDDTAVINVAALLIGLLTLQLPNVPFLINLILASPYYAAGIYIIWFIFVKTTPLLG